MRWSASRKRDVILSKANFCYVDLDTIPISSPVRSWQLLKQQHSTSDLRPSNRWLLSTCDDSQPTTVHSPFFVLRTIFRQLICEICYVTKRILIPNSDHRNTRRPRKNWVAKDHSRSSGSFINSPTREPSNKPIDIYNEWTGKSQ